MLRACNIAIAPAAADVINNSFSWLLESRPSGKYMPSQASIWLLLLSTLAIHRVILDERWPFRNFASFVDHVSSMMCFFGSMTCALREREERVLESQCTKLQTNESVINPSLKYPKQRHFNSSRIEILSLCHRRMIYGQVIFVRDC